MLRKPVDNLPDRRVIVIILMKELSGQPIIIIQMNIIIKVAMIVITISVSIVAVSMINK